MTYDQTSRFNAARAVLKYNMWTAYELGLLIAGLTDDETIEIMESHVAKIREANNRPKTHDIL